VDVLSALLNAVLVVLVVATMLSAGLRTAITALVAVLRYVRLVLLVLVTNLVVVPLIGLGVGVMKTPRIADAG
jgi:BASS family bile acid:Na+ symporter